MLKPYKDPYGYQKLLAYQKAEQVQISCGEITRCFPRAKTLLSLSDQMDRSARSGKQNIVEGWKRNTTKEYYDFLGFSIGAIAELEEDCNDIWKGFYFDLMGIKGIMGVREITGSEMGMEIEIGERGIEREGKGEEMRERGIEIGEKETPLNPLSSDFLNQNPLTPLRSASLNQDPLNPLSSAFLNQDPLNPLSSGSSSQNPLTPLNPINPLFDIEKLKFYPLDEALPPIVKLKLRCKELNFLLHRLQESLLVKMDQEKTLPTKDKIKISNNQDKQGNDEYTRMLEKMGFETLENGEVVKRK